MKPLSLLWAATFVAACASVAHPTSTQAERLEAARKLLPDRPIEAADIADALLADQSDLREARLLAAECSLLISRQPGAQYQLQNCRDAVTGFERGLDGAEADFPREMRLLAEARYDLGNFLANDDPSTSLDAFEAGSEAAAMSAQVFGSRPGQQNQVEMATSRLVGAKCDFRRFLAARRAELDNGAPDARGQVPVDNDTLALANLAAAGFGAARRDHPGEASVHLAAIHRWLGRGHEALLEYERGIALAPEATAIHDDFISWMCDSGQQDALVSAYDRLVRKQPEAPILRWYGGRASFAKADRLRGDGNFQGAIASYEKSRAAFDDYTARMPAHRADAAQWQALCDLSMARCAIDAGDLRRAEELLFRAADTSPATTAYPDGQPALYDSFGNHYSGAAFAIHTALTQSAEDALEQTLSFNEALLQRTPDRWGFVYNNAALAARDLGVRRAAEGDTAAAKQLWEKSYLYYCKAVELSPDDARTINDCAVMLIYHLDRDLDRARQLLDRAIETGTEQLAALPDDADAGQRQRLEEAVGDAWQNIAVLLREQLGRPFSEYRSYCEKAVNYYPYQRREAAALLRNEGAVTPASTARANLADRLGAGDQQGGAAEELQKAMPAIQQKLDTEDYDSALTLLDALATSCKDHAPYRLLTGRVNLLLGRQAAATGRQGAELFFQDAVSALKRAVELDAEPVEPRLLLATATYESGDVEAAAATVSSLLLHMQSQGGGKPEDLLAAHTLRANAAARAYASKKSAGDDDKELLTAARTSLRHLEQKDKLDAALLELWSNTEIWAGAPAEAVNVYARASNRAPEDFGLLEALVSRADAQKQLPLAVEALARRDDAGTIWYGGKARFLLACQQRLDGKNEEAMQTLEEARRAFEQSMAKNAAYRDSCEQYIAMCLGKQGNAAFAAGNVELAEQLLLQSAQLRPDRIFEDLGMSESTKGGILWLVDKWNNERNLKKVEAISRAAAAAANSDVDLLNNAGLFARDYGTQLEDAGKKAEAREMFEQSYKAYRRALQIDPASVGLRNDTALIAIYHLERDWELSKQLLDSAIADGERMLQDAPPSDPNEKQRLEMAVGDSYENLALWHLKHEKDGAAAKAAATKSLSFFPGNRRPGARAHLQAAERLLQNK